MLLCINYYRAWQYSGRTFLLLKSRDYWLTFAGGIVEWSWRCGRWEEGNKEKTSWQPLCLPYSSLVLVLTFHLVTRSFSKVPVFATRPNFMQQSIISGADSVLLGSGAAALPLSWEGKLSSTSWYVRNLLLPMVRSHIGRHEGSGIKEVYRNKP